MKKVKTYNEIPKEALEILSFGGEYYYKESVNDTDFDNKKKEFFPVEAEIKTREVANWKIRAILKTMNLISPIETALNNLNEPLKSIAQSAWEYSPVINQYSNTVKLIQSVCELSDEQIQSIFDSAEAINI